MAEIEQLPYGTFGMFDSCVERFVDSVVPTTLNRHVLHDLSGADYSALGAALRFFDLVDGERKVKPGFKHLVEAKRSGGASYKEVLQKLLEANYPEAIKQVDVERSTLPDLEKAFKDAGAKQGQMTTKALRFYIKALSDGCGVKVSEHITKQKRRPKGSKVANNKTVKQKDAAKVGPEDRPQRESPALDSTPKGFSRLPIPGINDGFIQYPADLTAAQCKLLEGAVTLLKTYVEVSGGAEDSK